MPPGLGRCLLSVLRLEQSDFTALGASDTSESLPTAGLHPP